MRRQTIFQQTVNFFTNLQAYMPFFSGAKYYLLRLLCTNLISHSLSLNFYIKILNWANRFVQAQFFNNISQSCSVAHRQSVCFSPQSSPVQILRLENSGKRKEILQSVYSESKGPNGRSQIFQMLSDSPIAYSQSPPLLCFQRRPQYKVHLADLPVAVTVERIKSNI